MFFLICTTRFPCTQGKTAWNAGFSPPALFALPGRLLILPSGPRSPDRAVPSPAAGNPSRLHPPMKIVDIRVTGLSGGTVDGGWPGGNKPEQDLNTLVEVVTDEGLLGV